MKISLNHLFGLDLGRRWPARSSRRNRRPIRCPGEIPKFYAAADERHRQWLVNSTGATMS